MAPNKPPFNHVRLIDASVNFWFAVMTAIVWLSGYTFNYLPASTIKFLAAGDGVPLSTLFPEKSLKTGNQRENEAWPQVGLVGVAHAEARAQLWLKPAGCGQENGEVTSMPSSPATLSHAHFLLQQPSLQLTPVGLSSGTGNVVTD